MFKIPNALNVKVNYLIHFIGVNGIKHQIVSDVDNVLRKNQKQAIITI